MSTLSFTLENNKKAREKDLPNTPFGPDTANNSWLREGMSPQQIADVVSDRLMDIIKEQFETAKKEFVAK